MKPRRLPLLAPLFLAVLYLAACSPAQRIARTARHEVLADSALRTAHVGITVYEPATGKTWYDHQGDRYFVPASNTKIPTCYAAMKYLGDSLAGLRYQITDVQLTLLPTGDPTLLHPEFPRQPVWDFLKAQGARRITVDLSAWKDQRWGSGWAWNDYDADYMAERSPLPTFGNVIRVRGKVDSFTITPGYYRNAVSINTPLRGPYIGSAGRAIDANKFTLSGAASVTGVFEVPFVTQGGFHNALLLADTLGQTFTYTEGNRPAGFNAYQVLRSQPTDSLLKPMMHRSDNFFAEQSLLMVSNERLGIMSDARIIDTILKTDFADLPQKPRWVDGSGLSRYNLFTPQDFVAILNKMRNEFGMERVKNIFATGNEGTLRNYYKNESGYLFAKTGTLSGVVALSGFLYTKKNKLLIFSVLVNNHNASAAAVRRAVERFIEDVRERY